MAFLDLDGLRRFKNKLDEKFSSPIEAIRSWRPAGNGRSGQILRSNGDGTTSWQDVATSQDVAQAVDNWMDDHISPNTAIALDDSLTSTTAAAQGAAAGNMVLVTDTQPSSNTNKVWIKKTPEAEVVIPTIDDHYEVRNAVLEIENPAKQGGTFLVVNDLDSNLSHKHNVMTVPYDASDVIDGAFIFNDGSIHQGETYASYFVSPLINVSEGLYGLKVSESEYHVGNIVSGNNGFGFFAADGVTQVARPESSRTKISTNIYTFKVPGDAKYIRFTVNKDGTTASDFDAAMSYFNQWILLPDANDNIDSRFFVLEGGQKPDGTISRMYRADGSCMTIVDESARAGIGEIEIELNEKASTDDITQIRSELGTIGEYVFYGRGCPVLISDTVGTVVDLSFEPTASSYTALNKNLCDLGTVSFVQSRGYTFQNILPAGTYTFSAVVTSDDTDTSVCAVYLTLNGSIIGSAEIHRDNRSYVNFTTNSAFNGCVLCSARTYGDGEGDAAVYTDIQIEQGYVMTEYIAYSARSFQLSGTTDSITLSSVPTLILTNDLSEVSASSVNGDAHPKIPDLYSRIDSVNVDISDLHEEIRNVGDIVYPVNKLGGYGDSTYMDNSYIFSNGSIGTDATTYSAWFVSPKIPIKALQQYSIKPYPWDTSVATNRVRAYDSNNTPLEQMSFSVSGTTSTFTTPENASYIRINCKKTRSSFSDSVETFEAITMLVEGDTAQDYQGYFDPYYQIRGKIPPQSFVHPEFTLPLMYGKKIVNFGDSIFGNIRPPQDLSTRIGKYTGATVYNCAFGGCRMGGNNGHWDAFSMYRLADSIADGDYSLQNTALEYNDRPSYAEDPLNVLKSIDFNHVDMITIAYGTNDFGGGARHIDNENNRMDTNTLAGALRYSLDKLMTAYPRIRIVVLGLIYRTIDGVSSDTYTNNIGDTIPDYNAKLKEVCDEYHVRFIDNYNIGFNSYTDSIYYIDGTHPNNAGLEVYARHIARELN